MGGRMFVVLIISGKTIQTLGFMHYTQNGMMVEWESKWVEEETIF